MRRPKPTSSLLRTIGKLWLTAGGRERGQWRNAPFAPSPDPSNGSDGVRDTRQSTEAWPQEPYEGIPSAISTQPFFALIGTQSQSGQTMSHDGRCAMMLDYDIEASCISGRCSRLSLALVGPVCVLCVQWAPLGAPSVEGWNASALTEASGWRIGGLDERPGALALATLRLAPCTKTSDGTSKSSHLRIVST